METPAHASKSIIQNGNKYLFIKRSPISRTYPGTWEFPGGKDEPGEKSEDSVVREVKEETDLDIVPGPEVQQINYEDENNSFIFHYFTPKSVEGEIQLSQDHTEYKWLTEKKALGLELHPSVTSFFKNKAA